MYEIPYVECAIPDCKNQHRDQYWGRVKADGWVHLKNGKSFCHAHIPSWYKPWKSKKEN